VPERGVVGYLLEVTPECSVEDLVRRNVFVAHRGGAVKEGDRGVKFEVVGITEDLVNGAALDRVDETRALAQAESEQRMFKIGGCFVDVAELVLHGIFAQAEACDLGEDEPHPVAALATCSQLTAYLLVDGRLRLDKAPEVI